MMITEHLAMGILIANANEKNKSPKFTIISIVSCLIADVSTLFLGKPGEIDYLSHRIYTHSLIFAPIIAFVPVLLAYILFKKSVKKDVLNLYLVSLVSFLSHLFIDSLTPYGVQLFYRVKQ